MTRHHQRLPLPAMVRLRLWLARQVDHAAYWLVCQGRTTAAIRLYRATGLW